MTTNPAPRSVLSRLPSSLLAAAALTAVSLLLLGYEIVGAQRLGLLNLQAWWPNDEHLLVSQIGWHILVASFDRGLLALLPGSFALPGTVILTLVCWLAWGYALVFILRQACHSRLGGDSLAWLGALFVLPAALILLPLLYLQLVPNGQAGGEAGLLGLGIDLAAAAALIFLAGLLLLPRRIGLGVVLGQALAWGLIYAVLQWVGKTIGVPALGPLAMLVWVGLTLSLCLILALQRATAGLASFDDLGASQAMEYTLMVLAGLAASKDKISSADLARQTNVPAETSEEILHRLKEASLARLNQGLWAGVWPAERIEVADLAKVLRLSSAPQGDSVSPLVLKAQSLGWQGVSLADLMAPPASARPKSASQASAPEPVTAAVEAVVAEPAMEPTPEPVPDITPELSPELSPEPTMEQQAQHVAPEVMADVVAPGQRLVRSPEQSAPQHATPQSRALHLALGRHAEREAGPAQVSAQASAQTSAQTGIPPQSHAAPAIIGAHDYQTLATGEAVWVEPPEPNDDSVTLDAIRREIQDLMDKG